MTKRPDEMTGAELRDELRDADAAKGHSKSTHAQLVEAVKAVRRAKAREARKSTAVERLSRLDAAKAEHAAVKAWRESGKQGDRPETPNLDALNEDHAAGGRRRTKRPTGTRRAAGPAMVYLKNGRPMNPANNSLSSLAWQATKDLDPESPKRVSTARLREILADVGVTDPTSTEWEVELANGAVIGAAFADTYSGEQKSA